MTTSPPRSSTRSGRHAAGGRNASRSPASTGAWVTGRHVRAAATPPLPVAVQPPALTTSTEKPLLAAARAAVPAPRVDSAHPAVARAAVPAPGAATPAVPAPGADMPHLTAGRSGAPMRPTVPFPPRPAMSHISGQYAVPMQARGALAPSAPQTPAPLFERPGVQYTPYAAGPAPVPPPLPGAVPAMPAPMAAMPAPTPVAAPVREARNGLGLAAVILGPIAILFGLVPLTGFVATVLGIVGLALGLAGIGRLRTGRATNTIGTTIGVVLSAIGVAMGIYGTVVLFQATIQLVDDLNSIPAPPSVSVPAT